MLVTEGKDRIKAIGSSGKKGAEQKCAALLGKEMIPFCAVQMAHGMNFETVVMVTKEVTPSHDNWQLFLGLVL